MTDYENSKSQQRSSGAGSLQQPISASTLLQGRQQVRIEHEGEIYRLLLTRNNKLLLQK